MSTLDMIESEVKSLSLKDLAKFREWFSDFEARAWDLEIERDVLSGKLDALANEALVEYADGQAKEI